MIAIALHSVIQNSAYRKLQYILAIFALSCGDGFFVIGVKKRDFTTLKIIIISLLGYRPVN